MEKLRTLVTPGRFFRPQFKGLVGVLLSIVAGISGLLSGCATPPQRQVYTVAVSGLSASSTNAASSFIILPADTNVIAGDLQFQEYAGIVERALTQRGFRQVASATNAEVAIFLAYGISEPKEHVYAGRTATAPATPPVTIQNAPNYGASSSDYPGLPNWGYGATVSPSDVLSLFRRTPQDDRFVTYTSRIGVVAVDLAASLKEKRVVQLWAIAIVGAGPNGDLRRTFPIMVGAALGFFGTNTGQVRTVQIYEDDPRVMSVRGIGEEEKK